MATPELNPAQRVAGVIANLLNRDIDLTDQIDLELVLRVVTAFSINWHDEFVLFAEDSENPTNSELSRFFLLKMTQYGRSVLRGVAIAEAEEQAEVLINQAADEADLVLN